MPKTDPQDADSLVIGLNKKGFHIGALCLGIAPSGKSLSTAMKGAALRRVVRNDGNCFSHVADDFGVSFLTEAATDRALWLHLSLEIPNWRPQNEGDPQSCYAGRFLLNNKGIPLRPLTVSLANMLRVVEFDGVELSFVPHGRSIAVIRISFQSE